MAKGFTVKAKEPPKGKEATVAEEWDYDRAREMLRGKSIVFCLPVVVLVVLPKELRSNVFDLVQMGASIQISQDYSSMVNFARCKFRC